MVLAPVLRFAGDCDEAIDTYVAAFDADIREMTRQDEASRAFGARWRRPVVDARLRVGVGELRLADVVDSSPAAGANNKSMVLAIEAPLAMIRQALHVLSEQGIVLRGLVPTAASEGEAIVQDRFGVVWELTAPRHV